MPYEPFTRTPGFAWYRWQNEQEFHAVEEKGSAYPNVATACGEVLDFRHSTTDLIQGRDQQCPKCVQAIQKQAIQKQDTPKPVKSKAKERHDRQHQR